MFLTWSLLCLEALYSAEKEALDGAISSYFLCEAVGHVPGRCSRETFERYSHRLLHILIYYILPFFIPVVNLVCVINCKSIKEGITWFTIVRRLKSESSKTPQSWHFKLNNVHGSYSLHIAAANYTYCYCCPCLLHVLPLLLSPSAYTHSWTVKGLWLYLYVNQLYS